MYCKRVFGKSLQANCKQERQTRVYGQEKKELHIGGVEKYQKQDMDKVQNISCSLCSFPSIVRQLDLPTVGFWHGRWVGCQKPLKKDIRTVPLVLAHYNDEWRWS